MPRRDLITILLLGALGFGLYQVLWSTALRSTSAGESALIIAATPVMTALIASVAGTDTLTREKAVGIAISMLGVVVVVASGRPLAFDAGLVGPALTLAGAARLGDLRGLRCHAPAAPLAAQDAHPGRSSAGSA